MELWRQQRRLGSTDEAANAAQDLAPVVLVVKLIRESADGGLAARVVSAESWTFVFCKLIQFNG